MSVEESVADKSGPQSDGTGDRGAAEEDARGVRDEVVGMCVKKVSCKQQSGASCSKTSGPKVRHAPAAADEDSAVEGIVTGRSLGMVMVGQEDGGRVNAQAEDEVPSAAVASSSTSPTVTLGDDFGPEEDHAVDDAIYDENDVQSMDAIERRDFEREQQLIGGVIIRNDTLTTADNKLKLNILNHFATANQEDVKREKVSSFFYISGPF